MSIDTRGSAPAFSFGESAMGLIGPESIHQTRLLGALGHLGVSPELAADTAVHFADLGHKEFFGAHHGGSLKMNLLFPFVLDVGFQRHQGRYAHKILLNVYRGVGRDFRKLTEERIQTSKKHHRGMREGDWVAMILAHELGHTLPGNNKFGLRKSHRRSGIESRIDDYMAQVLSLGDANPWRGVVTLKTS